MRVAALVFRDDRGHDGVAAGKGDADPQDALLIFSQVGKFVLHCPVFVLEVTLPDKESTYDTRYDR